MKLRYLSVALIGWLALSPLAHGQTGDQSLALSPADAEAKDHYRITNSDFETVLYPEPESFHALNQIPQNTTLKILNRTALQEGKFKVNWYEVKHEGQTGWVRGTDFEDGEKESSYSMKYTSPTSASNPLTGTAF